MSDDNQASPDARLTRRGLVSGAAAAAGGALLGRLSQLNAQIPAGAPAQTPPAAPIDVPRPVAPIDAALVPGAATGPLTTRAPYENPAIAPANVSFGASLTPLQSLQGTITPSDLHFQRLHNGIPLIDPDKWSLTVHGRVDHPLTLSLSELKRFPSVTRPYFIECSGNGRAAYRTPKKDMTAGQVDGMTSNSEWTGVPVSLIMREVGVRRDGEWVLAEGGDAARMARSIPMSKMLDDAILVYAQNGEPLRQGIGYPVRLLLPGYEGNMNVKWLRRLEVTPRATFTRNETAKYTDPLSDGTIRLFSFEVDAKSVITSPTFPSRVSRGWWPVSGIAWSGRGKITRVEVSTDSGSSWHDAQLQTPVLDRSHVRFVHMWQWDGRATQLLSRATDETGYVQPTLAEFRRVRGVGTDYHYNAIRVWDVQPDGQVFFNVDVAGAA